MTVRDCGTTQERAKDLQRPITRVGIGDRSKVQTSALPARVQMFNGSKVQGPATAAAVQKFKGE
jgi:hypothetical protein